MSRRKCPPFSKPRPRRREMLLHLARRVDADESRPDFQSGDPLYAEEDTALERTTIDRLNRSDIVAWCWAQVTAYFTLGIEPAPSAYGLASLGACSFDTEATLWAEVGPDLDYAATREAVVNVLKNIHQPNGPRDNPHMPSGVPPASAARRSKVLARPFARWLEAHPDWAVFADRWLLENT